LPLEALAIIENHHQSQLCYKLNEGESTAKGFSLA
jgi:hypothetical protein